MTKGPLTGSYVRDVRVILFDGKMHAVDSNDLAFKTAGMMAFKENFVKADPQLLEPFYHVTIQAPEELTGAIMSNIQTHRANIESMNADGELAKQEAAAKLAYEAFAQELSAGRHQKAPELSQKITGEMQRLSLAGGRFEVALTPQNPAGTGLEQVEFLVAGHVGVEARPLNKVASGGELSRVSLAIRVVTAQQGSVPTMIFDEVDVGIGGGVAEVVGQLLKQLGVGRQVLVITHLPQVASQGAQHLNVKKIQRDNVTLSSIEPLDEDARVEEIARMLGGVEITETTRQHARENASCGGRTVRFGAQEEDQGSY
jgi:DNA repair protein RecN (Recombination protein N)